LKSVACFRLGTFALVLALNAEADAALVAMLLDVKGEAIVTYAGRTSPAQIATSLQEDSRIDLAAGAQITLVHYARREQIGITGPATAIVTSVSVQTASGTAVRARKLGDEQERITTKYRGRVVPGAISLRGVRPPIELAYPRDGETLIDETRAFAWGPDDPKGTFTVRLFADDKLVNQTTVTGSRIAPGALAALAPGIVYRLQVAAGDDRPTEVAFTLATATQREGLKSLMPSDLTSIDTWVLYAMALEVEGAQSAAREAWAIVSAARPDAAEMVRRIAR
jgi:hypothetical protein